MEGGMAGVYIMGGGIIIIIPRCGIGCGFIICSTGFTGGSIIIFDDRGAAVGGGIGMGSCMFSTIGAWAWGSISGIVTAKGRSVVGGGGFA
jgi:hypothetical protein